MRLFLILFILISLSTGCITKRGTKVDIPSSGRVITPSELERQPNGTYKIKPRERTKISNGIPYNPAPSNIKVTNIPAPAKPIISRPKLTPTKSAEAEEPPLTAKGVGKITPFSPTVTSTANTRVNVIPLPKEKEETTPEIASPREAAPVKIHWYELWMFYLAAFLALVAGWMAYKSFKDVSDMLKKESPPKKTKKKRELRPKTKK